MQICGESSAGIVTLNQPVYMNLDQSGRKLLVAVPMVIISPIPGVRNAVGTVQPRPQIEIGTAFAAERVGFALAWLAALRTGNLLSKRRDTGRLRIRHPSCG